MDWTKLLTKHAFSTVLPKEYEWILLPLTTGITMFLSALPPKEQTAIATKILQLGRQASFSKRLALLARCSPVLHKLAQILARDQRLSLSLRLELQKLEWLPPAISLSSISEILTEEFGKLKDHNIQLANYPTAEASVAVVIPFTFINSKFSGLNSRESWDGVFKLLKPGIRERLEMELETLEEIGSHLARITENSGIPQLPYKETFNQVANSLRNEVTLDREQRNLVAAAKFYKGMPEVLIPTLFSPCSENVTAMEWVCGSKIDSATTPSITTRRRIANLLTRHLLAAPLFNVCPSAIFHADPHAGNIFYTNDDRLAFLDWSLASYLRKDQREIITKLCLAAAGFQEKMILSLIYQLAANSSSSNHSIEKAVEKSLQAILSGKPPGFTWLIELIDLAAASGTLSFPPELLLFRKTILTLSGQIQELTGDNHYLDTILLQQFLQNLCMEWPNRFLHRSDFSNYSTHLSNEDLFKSYLQGYWNPWNYNNFF